MQHFNQVLIDNARQNRKKALACFSLKYQQLFILNDNLCLFIPYSGLQFIKHHKIGYYLHGFSHVKIEDL